MIFFVLEVLIAVYISVDSALQGIFIAYYP